MSDQYQGGSSYVDTDREAAIRRQNIDYINQRWEQLYNLEKEWADRSYRFLFYTNSGGAIATLSFMGAAPKLAGPYLTTALVLFVSGIVSVGFAHALSFHMFSALFEAFKKDATQYIHRRMDFNDAMEADNERSKPSVWLYFFPYTAFACFIAGCVCGGIALIRG